MRLPHHPIFLYRLFHATYQNWIMIADQQLQIILYPVARILGIALHSEGVLLTLLTHC